MASDQQSSHRQRAPVERRGIGFLLSLAANILILIMLLRLAPDIVPRLPEPPPSGPITVELDPSAGVTRTPAHTVAPSRHAGGGASRPAPAPEPAVPPPPPSTTAASSLLVVSRDVLAATDLAMRTAPSGDARAGDSGAGGVGTGSGADKGVGTGPGGQRLYKAEWYVRPTPAQLDYYLPARAPHEGWGTIGCRTVANYHVEDCFELDESPAGAGFSRALRQAAWQLLVRPPRIGGHPMVGAWVSIRIEYYEKEAK